LTNSGGSSFSNEAKVEISQPDSLSPLRERLNAARLEWPEGSSQYFLPADDLESLITVESIKDQLFQRCVKIPFDYSRERFARRILCSAPKLFCILVQVQQPNCITAFLEEGLDDTDLPFTRDGKVRRSGNFRLCSNQRPNQTIKAMENWTATRIREFSREQWGFMAPLFKESDSIEHYKFDDNTVFPFTRDEGRNNAKVGGFGTVWEVDIHSAHHSFHKKVRESYKKLNRVEN